MIKKALIIGSEGQDGTILKLILKSKGYKVFGLGRKTCSHETILDEYITVDLSKGEYCALEELIVREKPDEIYYVAALHQSSQENTVADFNFIEKTIIVNQSGFIYVMEICKNHHPMARIIYTSSSLIFSGSGQETQNELTTTAPECIYSVTKSAAMEAAKYYRKFCNLFVSIGIMYNHESSLRNDHFLSKKIVNGARKVVNAEIDYFTIGDLSSITDWGYAPDYMNALWHILQLPNPDTFVISSGQPRQVKDWVEVLFDYLKMDWKKYVFEDKSVVYRNKPVLIGDNTKLLSTGWRPVVSFEEMVLRMYKNII